MSALILGSAYRRIPALELEYLPSRPALASHVSVTFEDGVIYAHSGLTSALTSLGSAHRYDLEKGSWDTITNNAPTFRSVGLGVYEGGIFIHGGYNQGNGTSRSITNRLDLSSGTLTTIPVSPSPGSRHDPASLIVGDRLYVFGGSGRSDYGYIDLTSNSWTALGTAPMSIRFSGVIRDGDEVYFAGGIHSNSDTAHADVYKFNLSTGQWSRLPNLPIVSSTVHLMILKGTLIAFTHTAVVRMFILSDNVWIERTIDIDIPRQSLTQSVQVGNQLFVVGGYSTQGRLNLLTRLTVNKF